MRPATLLRLYPRKWREKYGEEFVALLEETGVYTRTVVDASGAAAQERLRAMTPHVLRAAVLYVGSWLPVLILGAMLPPGAVSLSIFNLPDHERVLLAFVSTAVLTRVVDLALRGAGKVPETKVRATVIDTFIYICAVSAMYVWRLAVPSLALSAVAAPVIIIAGKFFGHTGDMNRALFMEWNYSPRPPSFTTLGLSA